VSQTSYTDKIKEYLQAAKNANTHPGKLIAFSDLLKGVFGVSSYEVVQNVEQYIKSGKLMVLKGRMDLRLGQTIMEFKLDLGKELEDAVEEIERYTAILRKNGQKVAACIVTDGLQFKVYSVREKAKEVRAINFEQVTPEQAIMFLDTFLFSGRKVPTADDLNMRFGPGSPIYEDVVGELAILFKAIKDPVKFELWSKNMQLVYGSSPPEEAFVSQTYLMVLVRLLLAEHLTKGSSLSVRDALDGRLFDSQGINIVEDDFFSWVLNPLFWSQVKPLLETLTDAFDSYDLEAVDEDIFKEIYQEIVKRGDRHRIGEYYTPEWLAELTLNEAVCAMDPKHERKTFSALDPACGSGTFLTNVIAMLKKNGCSLEEIVDNVYGIDLNPLAVAIARANYLLALGKLIEKRRGSVFIPVFMADSIRLPTMRKELIYGISVLAIDVDGGVQLDLPLELALEDSKLKEALTIYAEILTEYRAKRLERNEGLKALRSKFQGTHAVKEILEKTLTTIMGLVDVDKDSVWVFMMRNIYAPLRLKKKRFDLVIGNPPWVSFKFIENAGYKEFIKNTIFEYKLLESKQTDLFTHLDTSTAFYAKTADIYLRSDGILAFVMPRSVLTAAKQHEAFKKQQKPRMTILKILDVEKVNPLFNVDACSIIARKGGATSYPVEVAMWSGTLSEKNLRLKKATKLLTRVQGEYSPPAKLAAPSSYHDKILEGACVVPRTLWFIRFVPSAFGLNPDAPSIESLVLPDAKEPWKSVNLKGEVESEFIFATVTGKYLLPFKPQFLPIVLPIRKGPQDFKILSSSDLRNHGKLKMANWLDEARNAWKNNATSTSLKNFSEPMDYVNYHNKLILQKQNIRYFVVYTGSGTHIAAAVVDSEKIPNIQVGNARIHPAGFVVDYKTYWFGTNNEPEAQYLAAILNSETLDQMIKPHQSRGKFGPRDIGRLPFEFNVPRFDANDKLHAQIADLGVKAAQEAVNLQKTSRLKIKAAIPSMKEIDKLVSELLSA
jgi:type I restriction-modification system DNA methylase subunit